MIHYDILDSTEKCKILNLFEVTGELAKQYLDGEMERGRSLRDIEADIDVQVTTTIELMGTDKTMQMYYYENLGKIRSSSIIIDGRKYMMGADPYK